MADGCPRMRDIIVAFEKRHELLLSHLSELQVGSEESSGFRDLDIMADDQQKDAESLDDQKTDSARQANPACHPKLRRRNSDGFCNLTSTHSGTRRHSLLLHSTSNTRLPKLPLRRLSSDSTGGATQNFFHDQDLKTTRRLNYKQGCNGDTLPRKRNSIPENKGIDVLPQANYKEHQGLARRRSTSAWCSSARRQSTNATACEGLTWRIKLHKRNLSIEDDDFCDMGSSMSRSSSSSGFSSQSSLF